RSGLSIRAFCGAEGIGEHLFYWWRRELTQRDQHKAAAHRRVTGRRTRAFRGRVPGTRRPARTRRGAARDPAGGTRTRTWPTPRAFSLARAPASSGAATTKSTNPLMKPL